jgi:hypothetical protein
MIFLLFKCQYANNPRCNNLMYVFPLYILFGLQFIIVLPFGALFYSEAAPYLPFIVQIVLHLIIIYLLACLIQEFYRLYKKRKRKS